MVTIIENVRHAVQVRALDLVEGIELVRKGGRGQADDDLTNRLRKLGRAG